MKCYLHIGTEKTGSSLLQEWLYHNREVLLEEGVYLCKSLDAPNNRRLAAYFQPRFDDYFRDRGIADRESRDKFFDGFLEGFRAEIAEAAQHCHSVVVTSEHLSSRLHSTEDIGRLHEELSGLFDAITVICYVREQSSLRRSLYSTALRAGETIALDSFQTEIGSGQRFYNYFELLGDWGAVFGGDALSVGIYERERFPGGDIRKDFLQRIEFKTDPDLLDYVVATANEGLSPVQATLIRLANRFARGAHEDSGVLRREILALASGDSRLRLGTLHSELDGEIYSRFEECNRGFFARFFGEDANLFQPPVAKVRVFEGEDSFFEGLNEVLEALLTRLLALEHPNLVPSEVLRAADVDLLRDVAMTYETGSSITKRQAIRLMELAREGRPLGARINEFLVRHSDQKRKPAETPAEESLNSVIELNSVVLKSDPAAG